MDKQDPPSPTPAPDDIDGQPAEVTFREWFKANYKLLLVVAVGLVALYVKFTPSVEDIWSVAKAVIGLSLVIFVHELGHFAVAKWCNVHVVTFSIGFGPAIPGCKYKWGETTYMLALVPLGGYVQMVGQVDGDESEDEDAKDDPRSYKNKTVFQRMAIISAGVIMNVLLAMFCFVLVYTIPGRMRMPAVVSEVDTGSPAYVRGVPTGAVIDKIGSATDPYFEDLKFAVMFSWGNPLTLDYHVPGGKEIDTTIEPRKGDKGYVIGIGPPRCLQVIEKRGRLPFKQPGTPNSPAARAEPPFAFDDQIIGTTDPDNPKEVTELPLDPRKPNSNQRDFFVYRQRMRDLAGQPVVLRVLRQQDGQKTPVDIKVDPAFHRTLGARMEMGPVTAVRLGSAGDRAGVKPRDKDAQRSGDVIVGVEIREADGRLVRYVEQPSWFGLLFDRERPLDPVRLPGQLRVWAKRLGKAGTQERKVTLRVDRNRGEVGNEIKALTLDWDDRWRYDREMPMYLNSPWSIPELGVAYLIKTTVVGVDAHSKLGDKGLLPGDLIKKIRTDRIDPEAGTDGKLKEGSFTKLDVNQWANAFYFLQDFNIGAVVVEIVRKGETQTLTLTPIEAKDWPKDERGLLGVLEFDRRLQKADSIVQAVEIGFKDTVYSMGQVYMSIVHMFAGQVPVENLGGPLTIGNLAYQIASYDFWEFVFFLGLISVNLAVVNFLPIPVLDGGHMVFLIYEKIRGKPASENVRVGATWAGLLLLASLMIFVIFLDIKRMFFTQ